MSMLRASGIDRGRDRMFIVEVLIPVAGNDGEVFESVHHQQFETHLIDAFGGYSLLSGTVRGGWEDGGTIYADDTRLYAVALESITHGGKVGEVVSTAKAHYDQRAIF